MPAVTPGGGKGFRVAAAALNWCTGVLAVAAEIPACLGAAIVYTDGAVHSTWWLVYCFGSMMIPPLFIASSGIVPTVVLLRRQANRAACLTASVPLLLVGGLALCAWTFSGRH